MSKSFKSRALMSAALVVVAPAVLVAPAFAQGGDENVEDRIVVTGSRIARDTFTAESPVTVVDAGAIQLSGNLNLGESLRQQLAVGTGGFNSSSNLSGGGAASIDLRNLGADRVLNLINGRRVANFADALQNEASDLSFIPQAMIDRVEILRDGGSAVYGADAVTGVVNVILKEDFEGFQISGLGGISDFGDREQYQVQAVIGGNFDRGNVVIAGEYNYFDLVAQRDRPWAIPTISSLRRTGVTNGSGAHPGGTVFFDNANEDVFCTVPKALGGDEITDVGPAAPCPSFSPSSPDQLIGRYDYALQQSILNGSQILNLAGFGTYDISDNISAFLEMQYSNRQSKSVLDGNPIFALSGSPAFPDGWVVPGDNPYNPYPGDDGFVQIRPTSTVGPRNQDINATSIRTVFGLRGSELLNRFDWELSYVYTQVTATVVTDATFNLARANRISDPDACAADALCTAALKPGSLGALDVYRPGNWSESEINYFRQVAAANSRFELEGVSGFVSGDVFDLPAGAVGVAFGFDYRREEVENRPDGVTESGESVANQAFSTFGSYKTKEFFGEVNIPVLKDAPMIQELSLNFQGRFFDYSNFGSDAVWKAGLNWTVNDEVRLRGTYGTSFRAPTLVDVFSGGVVSFDFIDDPCDAAILAGAEGTPTRLANCASAGPLGVSTGFTQSAPQLPVLAGGDLADGVFDLEPEEARTYTVGIVYTPSFLDGFRLSADYWNIEVTNFLDTLDVEFEILDVCYDSVGLSAPECSRVERQPNGQLTGLQRVITNRDDALKTSGVDWAVEYSLDIGPGTLTLDHQGTYVLKYNIGAGEGFYASSSGNGAIAEYRLIGGARYDYDAYFLEGRVRHTPFIDDPRSTFDGNNPLNYDGIRAHTEIDLRAGWQPAENTNLVFGINNLTDKAPPYAFNTGNNTVPGLYGTAVIGRYFFLRATQQF